MTNIFNKIKTFWSYLSRPNTYPFLIRLVKSKLLNLPLSLDLTKEEATAWCQRKATTTVIALQQLFPDQSIEITPLREKYPQIFLEADQRVATCQTKMGGAGNLELLFYLIRFSQAQNILETGVAYGWSSLAVLLAIAQQSQAQLISTNLNYRGATDNNEVGCAVPNNLRQQWTLINEADQFAVPKALQQMPILDLCHYDSDKSYAGRLKIYPLLWQALKIGGYFISDDVGDNLAFIHFCKMLNVQPTIVKISSSSGKKYVGILQKQTNHPPKEILF